MNLFYRIFGEGKPLIILHGLLGMSDNWIMPARELAKNYKVILPDLRNHGNSPHSDEFHLQPMVNDIVELIRTFGLEEVLLLGHSLGGRIAISVALQHPDLVEKLVVVDIAPRRYYGNKGVAAMLDVMSRVDFDSMVTLGDIEEFLSRNLPDPKVKNQVMKNLKRNEDHKFGWKANLPAIVRDIEALMTPVLEETPNTSPALFIKAGRSDFVTTEDFKLILHHFPNAIIRTFPNADHWVHVDEPQLFLEEVNAFLEE
jgi:esterase